LETEPVKTEGEDPTAANLEFVYSAETAVHEPGDLWQSRLDAPHKEKAFQLVEKGEDRWVWCDAEGKTLAGKGESSRKRQEASTAEEVLANLDAEGITGAVLYPSIAHRCFSVCHETEMLDAFTAVYNDWILDLAGKSPERLKAVCLLNVDDPKKAASHMQDLSQRGAAAFVIPMAPGQERRYDMPQYEALWKSSHELKRPLIFLAGSNRNFEAKASTERRGAFQSLPAQLAWKATAWFSARRSITSIIFSGAFERYPDFHLGIVGYGAGWAPFAMVRGNEMQQVRPERTGPPTRVPEWVADEETIRQAAHLDEVADVAIDASKRSGTVGMAPEGVGFYFKDGDSFGAHFRRNVFLTFSLRDKLDLMCRPHLGKKGLLWGHRFFAQKSAENGNDTPTIQARLKTAMEKVKPEEREHLVSKNTATLFGFAN
jgi:predicted TIM-barrel fold metal-dependent hydrolase